jgi:hypothetical protein
MRPNPGLVLPPGWQELAAGILNIAVPALGARFVREY